MSVDHTGLKDFQSRLAAAKDPKTPSGIAYRALRRATSGLLGEVRKRTPVDTGNLRRGWTAQPVRRVQGGWEQTVANHEEYALYIEEGHRVGSSGFVEGAHMLLEATHAVTPHVGSIVDEEVAGTLKQVIG